MSDERRGIFRKFRVEREDGSSGPGKKHEHCEYFVLDWEHDPFAVPAARAYAESCEATRPELTRELRAKADLYESMRLARVGDKYPKDPTNAPEALQTLAAFARTAPGCLPSRVESALRIADEQPRPRCPIYWGSKDGSRCKLEAGHGGDCSWGANK